MKVPYGLIACVAAGAAAIVLAQPVEEPAIAVRPGRLVESASPNTGMVIPEWDNDSSVDARQPSQSEQGPNEPDAAPANQADRGSMGESGVAGAGELDGASESQSQSAATADDNAVTIIPRPSTVDQSATADGHVVPRGVGDSPWYRHPAIALFAVVVVIVGVAVLFRKYVPTSRMIPMQAVRVVGRAPISAKHSIALLHVGRRLLLVGMTADRVSTLSEITDPQEVNLLLGASGRADESVELFGAQLADQISQFAVGAADETGGADDLEDRSLLDETKGQLQNLMRKLRSLRAA